MHVVDLVMKIAQRENYRYLTLFLVFISWRHFVFVLEL